jgi:hypothetical protein
MRYSRENVITRDEYEARQEPRVKRRRVNQGPGDRAVARRAQSNPAVLLDWLERVEGRFMGVPADVSPEDALANAMRIAAGEVAYCTQQIARLSDDELFERPTRTVYAEMPSGSWEMVSEVRDAEVITRWHQLRTSAMDRMARYAKMALDVGLEDRQLAIHEKQAAVIARFFEAVMNEVELTDEQRKMLGPTMRRHLELIEGTAINVS